MHSYIFSCEHCQVSRYQQIRFCQFTFELYLLCTLSVLDYRFEWNCDGSSAVVCRPLRMSCLEWRRLYFVKLIHWIARKWAIINNYSFILLSAFLFPIQWFRMQSKDPFTTNHESNIPNELKESVWNVTSKWQRSVMLSHKANNYRATMSRIKTTRVNVVTSIHTFRCLISIRLCM